MILAGGAAGIAMGVVLLRGQLCFHSMFGTAWAGDTRLLRAWGLGVGIGAVGLSVLYLLPWADRLNHGLSFRPVGNIGGGLVIGVGMVIARSCVSGLFWRVGSGMVAALVGVGGWALGEYAASRTDLKGPTVLQGGDAGTVPGVLGIPRILVAVVLLAVVLLLFRTRRRARSDAADVPVWQWSGARLGIALGGVLVLGWVLARLGGADFGPSTVGAVAGIASGSPPWWLIAFLVGIAVGAALASPARAGGPGLRVRWETPGRVVGLVVGGFLLGAGGWVAGGCNLGHGLSGAAQLDVSSFVAIAAMAAGVRLAIGVEHAIRGTGPAMGAAMGTGVSA